MHRIRQMNEDGQQFVVLGKFQTNPDYTIVYLPREKICVALKDYDGYGFSEACKATVIDEGVYAVDYSKKYKILGY